MIEMIVFKLLFLTHKSLYEYMNVLNKKYVNVSEL